MAAASRSSTERRRLGASAQSIRLGAFLGGIDDSYQQSIWRSMARRAAGRGVEIVGIFGHGLGSPFPSEATMNVAYRMVGPRSLDALIVLANTVGNYEDPAAVARLVDAASLPAVSISFELGDRPRAYAPGGEGMATLVTHLARVHGRRSFALVTGPRRHPDSLERETAFRAALAAEGIALDERLVREGRFYKDSGRDAARSLLAGGIAFDALVCLNDYMALGALEVLNEAGLRVPEDLSLTGFDDVAEARWSSPPLSTVRQPIAELGEAAFDMALELLDSRIVASRELRCELRLRQSCGCPSSPLAAEDRAEGSADEIRRREVGLRLAAAERTAAIERLGMRLLGSFRLPELVREWELCLEPLGLAAGYILLFETLSHRGEIVPGSSFLLAPAPGGGVFRRSFPTELLFPPGIAAGRGRSGWILEPLVYQDEALGYLLLDCEEDEPSIYEMLRVYMSTAVKAALLMEKTEAHKRELELQVSERTRELREANRDLLRQIEERRRLEREVQEVSNRTMQSIGQDLHDDLCQHLAGVSLLAAVAEDGLASSGSVSVDSIRRIRELLDSAVSRSRQFARTLYPPALESQGLAAALEDLVEAQRPTVPALSLSYQAEGDCSGLAADKALCLYRIAQEALANALRHSESEAVVLRLIKKDELAIVEVRDFGRGLDGESRDDASRGSDARQGRGGMGMAIMRYRAEAAGAQLEIRNLEPGLCVSCSLRA
jgi:Transcriptional regulators